MNPRRKIKFLAVPCSLRGGRSSLGGAKKGFRLQAFLGGCDFLEEGGQSWLGLFGSAPLSGQGLKASRGGQELGRGRMGEWRGRGLFGLGRGLGLGWTRTWTFAVEVEGRAANGCRWMSRRKEKGAVVQQNRRPAADVAFVVCVRGRACACAAEFGWRLEVRDWRAEVGGQRMLLLKKRLQNVDGFYVLCTLHSALPSTPPRSDCRYCKTRPGFRLEAPLVF